MKVSGDAEEELGQSADVVMHTTSSSLPKVMDQFLACLDAGPAWSPLAKSSHILTALTRIGG